jgi:predicted flavoprotein YhiN
MIFSSIPSTLSSHLQIRGTARRDRHRLSFYPNAIMYLTHDSAANYSQHRLIGNGSTVVASGGASTTYLGSTNDWSNTYLTNNYGVAINVDVLDYASLEKFKTNKNNWWI